MVVERPKMNRKPIIILYCDRATQTQDDSEEPESDFPPPRIGNLPPLISSQYSPVLLRPRRGVLKRDVSEAEEPESDFPLPRVENLPPLFSSHHYSPVPLHSRHSLAASGVCERQLITISSSSEEESSQTESDSEPECHQRPGLGRSNIVNTFNSTATVSHTKVKALYISCT